MSKLSKYLHVKFPWSCLYQVYKQTQQIFACNSSKKPTTLKLIHRPITPYKIPGYSNYLKSLEVSNVFIKALINPYMHTSCFYKGFSYKELSFCCFFCISMIITRLLIMSLECIVRSVVQNGYIFSIHHMPLIFWSSNKVKISLRTSAWCPWRLSLSLPH